MKLGFNVKYGKNIIDVPTGTGSAVSSGSSVSSDMVDIFSHTVTVYSDIPSDGVNPRRWDRRTIERCMVYNTVSEGADGTVQKIVDTERLITKDTARYKSLIEYSALSDDEREGYYTVGIDDFIVLSEVDDVVTTAKEFQELQKKYKRSGFLVTSVQANIHGLDVDNVTICHA